MATTEKAAALIEGPNHDLAKAVSNLRQDRNAELQALRGKKSTNVLHHHFEAKKGTNDVVFDLNDFYMRQRANVEGDKKKRKEADKILHQYRQADEPKSSPITTKGAVSTAAAGPDPSVLNAADRAAAAAYLNSKAFNGKAPEMESFGDADDSSRSVLTEFSNADYRAFVFVIHQKYGMVLLHCTKKPSKGPHFQLPGGHIDQNEFVAAGMTSGGNPKVHLLAAAKLGAARELFEETSIDVRQNLKRLQPAPLRLVGTDKELHCELKKRIYFFLKVTDEDFWTEEREGFSSIMRSELDVPLGPKGKRLMLKLSEEHSGFKFQKEPRDAAELLKKHSGGVGSEALLMALVRSKGNNNNNNNGPAAAAAAVKSTNENGGEKATTRSLVHHTNDGTNEPSIAIDRNMESTITEEINEEDIDLLPKHKRNMLFACFECCY